MRMGKACGWSNARGHTASGSFAWQCMAVAGKWDSVGGRIRGSPKQERTLKLQERWHGQAVIPSQFVDGKGGFKHR